MEIKEKKYDIPQENVEDIIKDLRDNYYAVTSKYTEDEKEITEIWGTKIIKGVKSIPARVGTIISEKGKVELTTNFHEDIGVKKDIDYILEKYI